MSLGRNFHKALAASGFANLADGVMWVALPLLAVQLTRSPLLIAGVTVAARAPGCCCRWSPGPWPTGWTGARR